MTARKTLKALSSLSIWEVEDIAVYLGVPVTAEMSQREMALAICSHVTSNPQQWLSRLLCTDLDLLKALCDAGPGQAVSFSYNEQVSILEMMQLIEAEDSDDGFRLIRMGRRLHSLVAPRIDAVIDEARSSGKYELEQVMMGYLHLYGVIPIEEFVGEVMYDYYVYKGAFEYLNFKDFLSMVCDSPVVNLCREEDSGQTYLCSPCVAEPFIVIDAWKRFPQVKGYRRFSVKDALDAGGHYPFTFFGLKGKYGSRLVKMLTSLGYKGRELEMELHDIWLSSQGEDSDGFMDDLYYSVTQKMEEIGTFEEYKECMQVISDYANHSPKWFLKGYSAAQKRLLWIDLASDTRDGEWDGVADPGTEAPDFAKESVRVPMGPLNHFALPGKLYIPRIGLDDPCPCGSGLKYRNCHGRNLN